jgi:hypothetical protein
VVRSAKRYWYFLCLVAICASATAGARPCLGQRGPEADAATESRNRSHFQIPPTGSTVDPSKFLPEHFEHAAKASEALDLYRQVMKNPLNFLREPDQKTLRKVAESILNGDLKLDPNDPLMRRLNEEYRRGRDNLSPEFRKQWADVQNNSTGAGVTPHPTRSGEQPPADPARSSQQAGTLPNGAPALSSQDLSGQPAGPGQGAEGGSALTRWLLRQAESLAAKDGVLRNSPSFQRALEEFALSASAGASSSAPDSFSEMLYSVVPENWWSENASERLGDVESMILSHVTLPEFRLPRPGFSSIAAGAGPEDLRISDASGPEAALLWFLAALALGLGCWSMYRRATIRKEAPVNRRLTPGSWPVPPGAVRSFQDLIQAFEYLSLVKLGPKARSWNHRAIALELGGDEARNQQMAQHLARLYEQARYAPRPTSLSAHALDVAQSELVSLAGTSHA